MAKLTGLSPTLKKGQLRKLCRRLSWSTGRTVPDRTINAAALQRQMFRKDDPNHTSAVIFAAYCQALLDDYAVPDRLVRVFADYGLQAVVTGHEGKGEGSEGQGAIPACLAGFGIAVAFPYAIDRGARMGASAARFEAETGFDILDGELFVSWMTRYGAYTAINWSRRENEDKELALRKQNELLLSLHKDLRKLLPLTFNHVVMVMAQLAKKN